jgi:hypothetical protein
MARPVSCATLTTRARLTRVTPMPYATQVRSTVRTLVRVLPATKESIVPKTSTNANKDHLANTTEFALTLQDHLPAIARRGSQDLGARPT